ncbi:hypothetical protein D3C83_04380 [compost metagenome]
MLDAGRNERDAGPGGRALRHASPCDATLDADQCHERTAVQKTHGERQPGQHHDDAEVDRDIGAERIQRPAHRKPVIRQVTEHQPAEQDHDRAQRIAPPLVASQPDQRQVARGAVVHHIASA